MISIDLIKDKEQTEKKTYFTIVFHFRRQTEKREASSSSSVLHVMRSASPGEHNMNHPITTPALPLVSVTHLQDSQNQSFARIGPWTNHQITWETC